MAVRVGFIGTGGIANMHFNNLEKIRDAKVVAVCDIVPEKAAAAAGRFGATAYSDYHKMLGDEQLDAVYICVPPFAHGEPELAVIKKGCAMFVEKPVALDFDTLKKINRAVTRKGIITGTGYQDRYLDIIDRLKKFLKNKQVGLVMGYWMGGMPGVMWWRQKKLSGGQHVEQTTHTFDMARYLFGDVKRVSAVASKGLMTDVPKYDIEDASAVNLEFKSGLVGTIFSACFLKCGARNGLNIWGKDFYVEYHERRSVKIVQPGEGNVEEYVVGNEYALKEDKTFISAVKRGDGSKVRSPYSDAAKSVALSIAATESLKTGQFVKV